MDDEFFFVKNVLSSFIIRYEIARKTSSPTERAKLEFSPERPVPPLVCMSPSFARDANYPNSFEAQFVKPPFWSFYFLSCLFLYMISHFYRCFKCGLGLRHPFKNVRPAPLPNTQFMIVTVFPELQARAHMFDQGMYKFIGCTLDGTVKNEFSLSDTPQLKKILDKFDVKESKMSLLEDSREHLVYVSLGSCFNDNIQVYTTILDGIKSLDLESNSSRIRLADLTVVVSTGGAVFKKLNNLISSEKYSLPSNIVLVESVPQTEILKRASLFITHSGQNSVSEAVHFGGKY